LLLSRDHKKEGIAPSRRSKKANQKARPDKKLVSKILYTENISSAKPKLKRGEG